MRSLVKILLLGTVLVGATFASREGLSADGTFTLGSDGVRLSLNPPKLNPGKISLTTSGQRVQFGTEGTTVVPTTSSSSSSTPKVEVKDTKFCSTKPKTKLENPTMDEPDNALTEGYGIDLGRIVVQILTEVLAKKDLTIRETVNIKNGDIGEAVGAEDATALNEIPEIEGSNEASAILPAATVTKELLSNATVDMNLLSEEVSGGSGGTATTDEKRRTIADRRHQLLGQYAGAAVQIAEGMNAISNKFSDRASVLVAKSGSVSAESPAYVLIQETGRFVLFETLRGLVLSSTQMGVQAARLLNEQEVEVEDENNQ